MNHLFSNHAQDGIFLFPQIMKIWLSSHLWANFSWVYLLNLHTNNILLEDAFSSSSGKSLSALSTNFYFFSYIPSFIYYGSFFIITAVLNIVLYSGIPLLNMLAFSKKVYNSFNLETRGPSIFGISETIVYVILILHFGLSLSPNTGIFEKLSNISMPSFTFPIIIHLPSNCCKCSPDNVMKYFLVNRKIFRIASTTQP